VRTPERWLLLAIFVTFGLVAAACGSDDDGGGETATADEPAAEEPATDDGAMADVAGEVNISGSSTVEPVSVRTAELFEEVAPDVIVNVDGPGTGDGFQLFCAGETDISDASRQIKDQEAATCAEAGIEFIELEVGIDGITVLTSPANESVSCVNFGDLYSLFGSEAEGFKNWSDAQALADEVGGSLTMPDAQLDITAPGTESGTYDSFGELVLDDLAEERGQESSYRPDYISAADDNVIIGNTQGSDSSLSFVGAAFGLNASDVKVLEVDGGDGCTPANADTIASGDYPISRSLYIYVNAAEAASNPALAAYVDFYMTDGLEIAVPEVGYVALTDDAKTATRAAWGGR
jgi:phosphate transport system substrate-binding protein